MTIVFGACWTHWHTRAADVAVQTSSWAAMAVGDQADIGEEQHLHPIAFWGVTVGSRRMPQRVMRSVWFKMIRSIRKVYSIPGALLRSSQ